MKFLALLSVSLFGSLVAGQVAPTAAAAPTAAVAPTPAAPAVPLPGLQGCTGLCSRIRATCTGANEQYADQEDCVADCENHPHTILDGAHSGDTFECRAYHVGVATLSDEMADAHCSHTGKDGGGVCVKTDACKTFCETFRLVACPLDVEHAPEYETQAKCEATCNGYTQTGLVGAMSGDTYQCREYHLSIAFAMGADLTENERHCSHTRSQTTRHCVSSVSSCKAFCQAFEAYCDGEATGYANCEAECESFPTNGMLGATAGDSLQCREYHLGVAALGNDAAKTTHCPHAQLNGGAVCVGEASAAMPTTVSSSSLLLLASFSVLLFII